MQIQMNEFLFSMILTELEDAVGVENCSTRQIDKVTHSVDYYWLSRMWADRGCRMPEADIIVCPKDATEVSKVVKIANYYKLPVTTWGAGGGTQGGAIPVCGGLYDGVEELLALTDIMIPSEEFALGHTGEKTAEAAANKLYEMYSPKVVVVTEGKRGGTLFDGENLTRYPIYPAKVVDSNGSGDVFHGAFAFALTKGYSYEKCCHFSSAVSAIKCMGVGTRESVPSFETVKKYMKENGYEL